MNHAPALALTADVLAARDGCQAAFARLVDATSNTVTAIALAILRDADLAADVAQDVYVAAWTDLGRLREPTSFLPWLRQVTRNRARQTLRAQIRRRRRISDGHADDLLAAVADPRPDAAADLVAREEREAVAAAIDDLPPGSREVVILYYREGRSARQVAALLGIREEAVKQRLSRARTRLRREVLPRLEGSVPTAAFTAGVMTAVSLAAPPAAAAATLTAVGSKTAAKLGTAASTGAFAGALAGLAGGLGGVFAGTAGLLRLARDREERRGVLYAGAACAAVVLAFVATVLAAPRPLPVTVAFAGMLLVFWVVHFRWLPRVTRRRHLAERREDPEWAAAEHARRARHARLGFAAGALMGGAAVAAAWIW